MIHGMDSPPWRCATCGAEHPGPATVFGPDAPEPWLSADSMRTTIDHWTDPERASLDPMFGWVCNELGVYDSPTMPVATHVHTRAPGVAPFIEVDPTIDHPLAREQSEGITLHRVAELNRLVMGDSGG
jgi:hypothetical protein